MFDLHLWYICIYTSHIFIHTHISHIYYVQYNWLLLVCRNAIIILSINHKRSILGNSFINFHTLSLDYFGFSMKTIKSFSDNNCFGFLIPISFLFILVFLFSYFISRISSIMLIRRDTVGITYTVSCSSFCVHILVNVLYLIKQMLFHITFNNFATNGCWILCCFFFLTI